MRKQTLSFLGRDSGFGIKKNSAYIEYENKFILIDCGFTVFSQLKNKFDFNKYNEIDVIITHLHNDHAGTPEDAYELKKENEYIKFIKTEHVKYLDAYGFELNINSKKLFILEIQIL